MFVISIDILQLNIYFNLYKGMVFTSIKEVLFFNYENLIIIFLKFYKQNKKA